MKNKKISLILVISMVLFSINLIPVSANQISVIGAATSITTSQITIDIPAGDYHVLILAEGYLIESFAADGVAICTASNGTIDIFAWTTSINIDNWTGQVTFSYTTAVTFTFEIQTTNTYDTFEMTWQIVFTDLDVATITKSSIIAEAPYELGIIGIALIGVACVHIRRRRQS